MSISEIAQQLKMNRNSVAKYLEILLMSREVEGKTYGTSKVYTLSQRVPVSAMLGFSSDMIIMLDSEKRILQANDLFLQFAKVKREVLIGQSIEDTGLSFLQGLPIDAALTESAEKKTEPIERTVQHNGNDVSFGIKLVSTIFDDWTHGSTIDTRYNDLHCGSCGTTCNYGDRCNNRYCVFKCQLLQTYCSSQGCFNLLTDSANCGICGHTCNSFCIVRGCLFG
jgi:hypothetical protein